MNTSDYKINLHSPCEYLCLSESRFQLLLDLGNYPNSITSGIPASFVCIKVTHIVIKIENQCPTGSLNCSGFSSLLQNLPYQHSPYKSLPPIPYQQPNHNPWAVDTQPLSAIVPDIIFNGFRDTHTLSLTIRTLPRDRARHLLLQVTR